MAEQINNPIAEEAAFTFALDRVRASAPDAGTFTMEASADDFAAWLLRGPSDTLNSGGEHTIRKFLGTVVSAWNLEVNSSGNRNVPDGQ